MLDDGSVLGEDLIREFFRLEERRLDNLFIINNLFPTRYPRRKENFYPRLKTTHYVDKPSVGNLVTGLLTHLARERLCECLTAVRVSARESPPTPRPESVLEKEYSAISIADNTCDTDHKCMVEKPQDVPLDFPAKQSPHERES